MDYVYKLHKLPATIVSYRDPFFLNHFENKFSISKGLTYIIPQFILHKLMVEQI